MGWGDLVDWIRWALVAATILVVSLLAVCVLLVAVCHVIYVLRRSLRGGAKPPPALSIEEVLERIPEDFPYQELPGGAGDEDDDHRESCVICVAPYEPGEACGVLPGCGHVFHKLCVAEWLRQNTTCPLCRAAFDVTEDTRQAVVDNMV